MKKEYHLTISRKDRIYLVLFVSALLGWELVKLLIPFPNQVELSPDQATMTPVRDTIKTEVFRENNFKAQKEEVKGQEELSTMKNIGPVPIMTASAEELTAIGFTKYVAQRIQKYISAGGQIRDVSGLKRIYGIDTTRLSEIVPLIIFPDPIEKPKPDSSHVFTKRNFFPVKIVELNNASASSLDSLPGIGLVLADRIIKFRTALGGFYDIAQIKECYGLSEETFEKVKPHLEITEPIAKFRLEEMMETTFTHPYLDKKIQRMLPNYIKNHGPIRNVEELRKVFPPDEHWCDRLLPYIIFSD